MSQIERIAYIDRTLREKELMTLREVAERFEVSQRQVKRDIEYLRDRLDAPILYDRVRACYRYDRPYEALRFADEKLLIFHALLKNIAGNQNYVPVATTELLATVGRWMSRGYRDIADRISYVIPAAESIHDMEDFTAICEGMQQRLRLEVDYENAKGERSSRSLEPERVINYSGRWYLIAYDLRHSELRTFHLARLKRVSISRDRSTAVTAGRQAAVEKYLRSGFGIFNGPAVGHAVVRIHGPAAAVVARQQWHPDQELETGTDPSGVPYTDMTIPVSDWREILGRVLSFGAAGEARAPTEFRTMWREEVRKMNVRANGLSEGAEWQS